MRHLTKVASVAVLLGTPVALLSAPIARAQEDAEPAGQTMRPVLRGRQAAVTSMRPESTEAARSILQAGGNAFDAAVGGQAALAVTDFALNGVGADAVLLVYDARAKKVLSINAEPPAPALATIEWYQKNAGGKLPDSDGLLAAALPTVVDAWYQLLDRWGSMSFERVLQPALRLAEEGFPLSERLARTIETTRKIRKYPTTMRLYQAGGKAPRAGDLFKNPDLARTLRKLIEAEKAAAGRGRHQALLAARDRFYKGDIAREMAAFSEKNGGLFRYPDFAAYSSKVETPVSVNYRGYEVYKNPSASQGPAELLILNLLEGFDLRKMGLNSADYIHVGVEAVKLGMADREKFLGDMDFIKIPYGALLSDGYAQERRKLIDMSKASLELRPGSPETAAAPAGPDRTFHANLRGRARHEGDTSYIGVVDQQRNMVSFEPSLHSVFGTGVVMGETGIIFNCRGDYYSLKAGEANALVPGKRPRSTLQSTLVMKDGQPFLITGSPGGDDQIMRTLQTLLNVVEFGMNIQQAIEAPRWSSRSFPASPFPHTMYPGQMSVEARIDDKTRQTLIARGHKLRVSGAWSLGSNAGILIDSRTGVLSAGADPRVEAYAWAW
jgi:gamma-glutamyltranspeptidase/glutathione hydrolase